MIEGRIRLACEAYIVEWFGETPPSGPTGGLVGRVTKMVLVKQSSTLVSKREENNWDGREEVSNFKMSQTQTSVQIIT